MATTATGFTRGILTTLHGREIGLAPDRTLVVKAQADGVTFSAASGAANTCALTIQIVNNEGAAVAGVQNMDLWLSDATTGAGLTAHANTSELTCSTGALVGIYTTEKAWRVQSDATGKVVAVITDAGKNLTVPVVQLDGRGVPIVATALSASNYG